MNKNFVKSIRERADAISELKKRYKTSGFWVASDKTICFEQNEAVSKSCWTKNRKKTEVESRHQSMQILRQHMSQNSPWTSPIPAGKQPSFE